VLKCNHDQGSVVLVNDKKALDREKTAAFLNRKLSHNTYYGTREAPYKDIRPVVFAEKMLDRMITDYKFYCFNGEAKYVLCCIGREEGQKPSFYFFDRNWELQRLNRQGKMAPEGFSVPKPDGIDQLFDIAEKLSAPFPFVRADFYLEFGKPWFGELTFTPGGGFDYGRLPESDLLFGSMVQLPTVDH
jgi:hypothetical protein